MEREPTVVDRSENFQNHLLHFLQNEPTKLKPPFYAVHIPPDIQIQDEDCRSTIYTDKADALKLVKKYKKARFKIFNERDHAVIFAMYGSDPNSNTVEKSGPPDTPVPSEKASQFRGPKTQDLIKLRKAIESGDFDFVRETVWENPRYLISIGDTPSILQEGFRYNALHVASKVNNHSMCELILNTIANVAFVKLLYPDDRNPDERAKILLDLYLNTPDKGFNETALHFASKYGSEKCVETLVSYPQCDKLAKNKYDKLARDIVCERYEGVRKDELAFRICNLLEDNYYVPVLRSEDTCAPGVIGEPFSPTSPPKLNIDPRSPRVEIHAYAGPMNRAEAMEFRRSWKTPPRRRSTYSMPRTQTPVAATALADPYPDPMQLENMKLKDPDRGLERVGCCLASQVGCDWKEYWPFLDDFADLSTRGGLVQLEAFLAERAVNTSTTRSPFSSSGGSNVGNVRDVSSRSVTPPLMPSSPKCPRNQSHLSVSGAKPTTAIENAALDIISPMTQLCQAMDRCKLNDGDDGSGGNLNRSSSSDPAPLYYIDKSLQVFARRIANDVLYQLSKGHNQSLHVSQTRQLHFLMSSFMSDNRFASSIDLSLVHSRLAELIRTEILSKAQRQLGVDTFCKLLDEWLEYCDKNCETFSTDDESSIDDGPRHTKYQHTMCIIKTLQKLFHAADVDEERLKSDSDAIAAVTKPLSPTAKNNADCEEAWKRATSCLCTWHTRVKMNLSRRRAANNSSWMGANSWRYSGGNAFGAKRKGLSNRRLLYEDEELIMNARNFCGDAAMTAAAPMEEKSTAASITEQNGLDDDEQHTTDDEFYTPPTSPTLLSDHISDDDDDGGEDDDCFDESHLPETDTFIEGDVPTKMDNAVYNAIRFAECNITPFEFPHIYRWRHTVSLYNDNERQTWVNPSVGRCTIGGALGNSTPQTHSQQHHHMMMNGRVETALSMSELGLAANASDAGGGSGMFTPLRSWLRITGPYSPRSSASLRSSRGNVSFNL